MIAGLTVKLGHPLMAQHRDLRPPALLLGGLFRGLPMTIKRRRRLRVRKLAAKHYDVRARSYRLRNLDRR